MVVGRLNAQDAELQTQRQGRFDTYMKQVQLYVALQDYWLLFSNGLEFMLELNLVSFMRKRIYHLNTLLPSTTCKGVDQLLLVCGARHDP